MSAVTAATPIRTTMPPVGLGTWPLPRLDRYVAAFEGMIACRDVETEEHF
ncbi:MULTISPECIES: hypothetical protein [unclassified Rhodococcus (in: high G+C Gram-positive bacteria)]|nr:MULTISPECIES: hypothetical protein [unclassified Rhodococcus (in: high G+C Gram-positive bacteria)]MBC2639232.1 hypothetical protein [Rhodococcus sp. 3A]MBC2896023.1 hypothetical protein [Rhodococcus sp. 4CII]